MTINGFPMATASAKGEQWSFRLYAIRLGSDVYRFIFAAKNKTAAGRPLVPRIDRNLPPHEPEGKRAGPPAAPEDRHRRRQRHRRERWRAAWRPPIMRSTASACSTALGRTTRLKPGEKVKMVVD